MIYITLIQKAKDYLEARKLKKRLEYLNHYIGCIQHDMHFGNPTNDEVAKANRKIEALYLERNITEGLLYSHDV